MCETTKFEPVDSDPEVKSSQMDPNNDVTVVEQVASEGIVSVPNVATQSAENVSAPPSSSDSQALSTSEEPVAENPEKTIFNTNDDYGSANNKSGDVSGEFDSDTTLQNTAIEVGQPGGEGAPGAGDTVVANDSGNGVSDVRQVSRPQSSEREPREDTVLSGATPKKISHIKDIDNSIFDSPRSSSTPYPKRGRPRQNRNNYNPDISAKGEGLRQTLDRLIKNNSPANSPVRRPQREKKEIDRLGNPVDHTKKKQKQKK